MTNGLRYSTLLLIYILITACGGGGGSSDGSGSSNPAPVASPSVSPSPTPGSDGAAVYMNPQPTGNTFACVHCHALTEPATDGFDRPGHLIGDALRRPNYKNGLLPDFIDAVNTCLSVWMTVPLAWTEETPEFQALSNFIAGEDLGDGLASPISFAKAEPLTFASDNSDIVGDPDAGQEAFNSSCAVCHGENAVGTVRAPQLAGRYDFTNSANLIARKVRLSGPTDHSIYQGDSVGGVMPFWGEDRISHDDLEDVVSYLVNSDLPGDITSPTPTPVSGSGCSSTHPSIGKQAMLSTIAHNVSGIATIVDDCTIQIDSFFFDGGGINIRVYGGDGDFLATGFSMGGNLLNQVFTGGSLSVRLPEDKTLDDIDRISIWCVPVRTSFGDGIFN